MFHLRTWICPPMCLIKYLRCFSGVFILLLDESWQGHLLVGWIKCITMTSELWTSHSLNWRVGSIEKNTIVGSDCPTSDLWPAKERLAKPVCLLPAQFAALRFSSRVKKRHITKAADFSTNSILPPNSPSGSLSIILPLSLPPSFMCGLPHFTHNPLQAEQAQLSYKKASRWEGGLPCSRNCADTHGDPGTQPPSLGSRATAPERGQYRGQRLHRGASRTQSRSLTLSVLPEEDGHSGQGLRKWGL